MSQKPETYSDLIAHLGGVSRFSEITGINEHTAKKMRDRNSIGVAHWPVVMKVSKSAGLSITADDLLQMRVASKEQAGEAA